MNGESSCVAFFEYAMEKYIRSLKTSAALTKANVAEKSVISDYEKSKMVEMHEAGMSLANIAETLNRSESAIRRHLKAVGVFTPWARNRKKPKINMIRRLKIEAMLKSGVSQTETAKHFKISIGSVHKINRELIGRK